MSYTNAVFYVNLGAGSDAARTANAAAVASNPSGSITRILWVAHGLVTGAVVDATLFTAWLNEAWKITVFDANNFDLDGAVWQTTGDATGTITPRGGMNKADAWNSLTTGASAVRFAAGDEAKIMESPPRTSLGVNGTWTTGPQNATQSIASSTNATPIVVTHTAHGSSNGDTRIISGHTTNTNANGTWTVANVTANTYELVGSVGNGVGGASGTSRKANNFVVTLASAVTKNVACPRDGETGNRGTKTNWTASANVTCTVLTTDYRQGAECQQIAIAAGFTTGLAAYLPMASAQDLSAYQQLTIWIKQTAGTVGAAGAVRLRLCSDTAGATPVDTFDVPNLVVINRWVSITVNKGSALGASIQSISLDVVTDNGAQTFLIDNVLAAKAVSAADSLSLTSLIGKNSDADLPNCIQSIVGTRVFIDQDNVQLPDSGFIAGYTGTSETVVAYKREPILAPMESSQGGQSSTLMQLQRSGVAGSPVILSFGWNTSDMTTQSGQTWYSGQNCFGRGLHINGNSFANVTGVIGAVRCFNGVFHGNNVVPVCAWHTLSDVRVGHCTEALGGSVYNPRGSLSLYNNFVPVPNYAGADITSLRIFSGAQNGITPSWADSVIRSMEVRNCLGAGVYWQNVAVPAGGRVQIENLVTSGNVAGAGEAVRITQGVGYLRNASIAEPIEVNCPNTYANARLISENHDGTTGNTQIFTDGGRIASEATVRHTASGLAWSLAVTSATRTATYPLDFDFTGGIAVAANALVTLKLWMRRTNTGLTFRFGVKGGQLAGVSADTFTPMSAAADTWEEVTVTFTPTVAGVIIPTVEAYGGTTYLGYIDDFTASQA